MCVACISKLSVCAGAPLYTEWVDCSRDECRASNEAVLSTLRPDEHEKELHEIAINDWQKGRMTKPQRVAEMDTSQVRCRRARYNPSVRLCVAALLQVMMVPRFGISQGLRPDGSLKLRAVDHLSWSRRKRGRKRKEASVNGHYQPDVEMKHDHLDDLLVTMRLHKERTSSVR